MCDADVREDGSPAEASAGEGGCECTEHRRETFEKARPGEGGGLGNSRRGPAVLRLETPCTRRLTPLRGAMAIIATWLGSGAVAVNK